MWVHFHARMISRSNAGSKSAVGAAAYQARERIEARGLVHDYTRRGDLVHKEILLPQGAPDWMGDRTALWGAAEEAADRSTRPDTAQTARAIDAALPRGLAREEQVALAREFAAEAFVARGMAVDLAIHDAPASDGGRNAHAHYLVATREVTPEGFGAVNREWARTSLLREWRTEWEAAADLAMERTGVMEREAAAEVDGGSGS
jgi:ATP-dependent exoDNAse (exonuclease V) alpha subunit